MNENSFDDHGADLQSEPLKIGISQVKKTGVMEAFEPDRQDGIFALLAYVLGFCFAHWVFFSWQGWGVTLFTLGYCAAVTIYFSKKGVHMTREGWFWLAIVILTGISFSLWTNNGLGAWPGILLFCGAVYWITCSTGLQILGKTSNLISLDFINSLLVIPFRNIGCQFKSLAFLSRNRQAESRQFIAILLGLGLTLIVMAVVLPLLMKADSGGFSRIANGATEFLNGWALGETIVYGILAIPIGAYLFGLVAGSAHKRGCDTFKEDSTQKFLSGMQILPTATVYTLLGLLCSLYVLFIGSQLPYFFSAFMGQRPAGWQVYSEYARSGFFELCRIAAINLIVLTAANVFGKNQNRANIVLKVLNSLLAMLTLILIATALSKMIMYIGAYGLSMRRLLPCVFMVFLAVICISVAALQKWSFSIARLAVGLGVVMLCLLCLANTDGFVANYNADRYLAGTLQGFDVEILYRSGAAGVDTAMKLYDESDDKVLRGELKQYLSQQQKSLKAIEQPEGCWQTKKARQKITERFL